ncbi:FAD-dependent oxidoreductase [Aerosakkonemataceae cyanobacterium BLCC-F50]|uniref:FAD-dependent oxidoreductase n=1 Tax=Floridaenema flaviceps BLCC-F50 TaxID=3153642 RepID=A0ABV4XI65_9CYAN
MVKKVAIVGAGPSGLLMAHYLLVRGDKYQIDIYERRSDPRLISFSKARTFPISLSTRGMAALQRIPGLVEAVKAISVEMKGAISHQKNGKTRVTTREKTLTTLDRTNLVIAILEKLTEKADNHQVNIHFNCQCTLVDFTNKTVSFHKTAEQTNPEESEDFTVNYDLLIAADGARSVIRNHFLNTELFELQQKYIPNDYKSVYISRSNELETQLKPGYIHTWRREDGTTMLMLHQLDGTMSGVVYFPRQKNQFTSLSTPEEVLQFFRQNFSEIGQLMTETEAEAFLARPVSSVLTIRCNRYHQGDSVLLIGDAAHAVSPSMGQGCNAALEDVAIFDKILDECSDNLAQAVQQFTVRRQADAYALVELSDNAFPTSKGLFIQFLLRESVAKSLHKLFPQRFPPSLFQMISETAIPYSEILQLNQDWVTKVKRANEKFFANL